mmetsp:Transcript_21718/g.57972  ORF Transcript_21718/g.57972 Transcript_21718/m.57972 type:complete len:262 (+) Transcript_21718:224-1009(+)
MGRRMDEHEHEGWEGDVYERRRHETRCPQQVLAVPQKRPWTPVVWKSVADQNLAVVQVSSAARSRWSTDRCSCSLVVRGAQRLARVDTGVRHHQPHDQAVQAEGLGEDEDEDHADEQTLLLGVGAHARVAHDADGQAGREGAHADREPGGEVRVSEVGGVPGRGRHLAVDDDGGDQAVNAEDAGHDHGDDGAHHQVRAHDAHGGDAHARLRGAVGRAEVREDDGGCHPHEAEEGGRRVARLDHGSSAAMPGLSAGWRLTAI